MLNVLAMMVAAASIVTVGSGISPYVSPIPVGGN